MTNLERFIKYAKIDTQADENSNTTPSTEKQKNLSLLLVEELKELGLTDAYMDEYGVVYAHLKGEGETIGFNAHVDTALEVKDSDCNPRLIENYNGDDINLNDNVILSMKQFPHLKNHIGHDLVVTDGNTLLGADDKAGIAIIMGALSYLKNHPEIKHHNLSVAFTPDEEIGRGPEHFDLKKMNADYCFTIDGSNIDHIDYENFSAKAAHFYVRGVAVHPGEGKNTLLNALLILNEFINLMPKNDTPFEADVDDGYWHITNINGSSESAYFDMILRDFSNEKLNQRVDCMKKILANLELKYPKAKFKLSFIDQYENMKPYVDKNPKPVEVAMNALKKNGIEPVSSKIRGGTDGATFSKLGLVTPNLGTGSYNHHGRYEFLDVQEFNKMIEIVISIMTL